MNVSMVKLSKRFQEFLVSASIEQDHDTSIQARTELDSHADSPVVGRNAIVLEDTGKTANVTGFTKDLGKCMSVPIVTAAVAYDNEYTGQTSVLIIHHNALHFTSMKHNLIPPFVIRLAGAKVNEEPKCLAANPSVDHHSIFWSSRKYGSEDLRIPLQLNGTISYLPTRIPHRDELENCLRYDLSPNRPFRDPHSGVYASQEHSMLDFRGEIRRNKKRPLSDVLISKVGMSLGEGDGPTVGSSVGMPQGSTDGFGMPLGSMDGTLVRAQCLKISAALMEVSKTLCHGTFASMISGSHYRIKSLKSGMRTGITASELSTIWNIRPELAMHTINATTQLCRRSSKHPSLARRYPTNDRMLRYNRLSVLCYQEKGI